MRQIHSAGWESEGSAFAVYHEGRLVASLWGGWADSAIGRRWAPDTITVAFSCTKAVSALAALILADRGKMDLDEPVAKYLSLPSCSLLEPD